MKMIIIGILDRKAQVFISMEPTPNKAVAIRTLQEIIHNDKTNQISKWPADFSLWELGSFDTETGRIEALTDRQLLIECENLKTV